MLLGCTMSCQENKAMGASEKSTLPTSVSSSGATSINVTVVGDTRSLPLLYVQSPISKTSVSTSNSSDVMTATALITSQIGTSVKHPLQGVNGVGGKVVQVQGSSPNSTFAYVGTLFKPGLRGQEPVTQKILLTPVKGKDGSITRFILPRPVLTPNTSQSPSSLNVVLPPPPGKPLSYVIQPAHNASKSIIVSTSAQHQPSVAPPHKVYTPNIIRQKIGDGKIGSSSVISMIPKVITVTSPSSRASAVITESLAAVSRPSSEIRETLPTSSDSVATVTTSTVTTAAPTTPTFSSVVPSTTVTVNSNYEPSLPCVTSVAVNSPSDSSLEPLKCHEVFTIDDEEKNSTKGSSPASIVKERSRKRKEPLSNDAVKKPHQGFQIEANKILPGAEDYDPLQIIEWDSSGMGKLPGSDIKFVVNDFGMLEVHEEKNADKAHELINYIKKQVEKDPDEIYCCVSCSCYGLISEFYDENFCSKSCRESVFGRQTILKKRECIQTGELTDIKKRRKLLQTVVPVNVPCCFKDENTRESNDYCCIESEKDPLATEEEAAPGKKNVKSSRPVIIELDDDNSSSPPNFTEGLLNIESKSDGDYKEHLIKVKKIIKKGTKISKDVPHRTYSKLDEKQKLNLRPRIIDKSDEKLSDNEESDQHPEFTVKQDLRKRNSSTDSVPDKVSPKQVEEFPWSSYLLETHSRPVWVKLFQNPYPVGGNTFKVGYKLEAIDPEHQGLMCAVTVVQTKGYRLKLHFDGYSKVYDFWVNADSPNIFPCGFCSQHGFTLQPPCGYNSETFSWPSYTSTWKSKAAPATCFVNHRLLNTSPNMFRVGMKLEAVDRKNSYLVCVATVAAVLDNRILVHFDSWGDVYDYWASTSSPYIHYVGWCKQTKHILTPPNGIKPSEFNWDRYLKETGAIAAPYRAFRLRPHIDFKKGTKLEAVDKRAPHLLRVATVRDVLPYQLRLTFDGYPEHFGYWVDDDSPDLHPVGWGLRTSHPIEPPPTEKEDSDSPCPTPGCLGQGHAKGTKFETHSFEADCPYSLENLTDDELIPDRMMEKSSVGIGHDNMRGQGEIIDVDKSDSNGDESDEDASIKRWRWLGVREENRRSLEQKLAKKKKLKRSPPKIKNVDINETFLNQELDIKSCRLDVAVKQMKDEVVESIKGSNPLCWDRYRVAEFATNILNKSSQSIIDEDIDGKALLMLSQEDLIDQLNFKLGDAIKLYNAILLLRDIVT